MESENKNVTVNGVKITLRRWHGGSWSLGRVDIAKLVKAELQARWPGTKFSVRSESGSMYDSVRASWTDGPTTAEVDPILDQYRSGRFDGMIDMAYSVSLWFNTETGEAIVASNPGSQGSMGMDPGEDNEQPGEEWVRVHGVRFTSTSRSHSKEALEQVAATVATEYGHETPEVEVSQWGSPQVVGGEQPLTEGSPHYDTLAQKIYQELHNTSFEEAAEEKEASPPAEGDAGEEGDGFSLEHDRDWTWVSFAEKPAEQLRETLKAAGGRWSRRRKAWYFKQTLTAAQLGLA